MNLVYYLLVIIAGFFVLTLSAKQAMKRTVNISRHFGVSEFVICFILVGAIAVFPEMSIGINSALSGNSSLGLGIVFGSNVADLTLVLGLVALLTKGIKLHPHTINKSKWFIFAVLLPVLLLFDGTISRLDGFLLILSFACYVVYMFVNKKNHTKPFLKKNFNIYFEIFILLVSLSFLLLAGKIINDAAQGMGMMLALPLIFLGIILAIGTCLPELMFAFQASENNHSESGFGDVLGNVVTDCLATLGIISMISPITPVAPLFGFIAGAFMIFSLFAVLFFLEDDYILSRRDGIMLISIYAIFLVVQTLLEYSLL
ncbi:sodium:calcium antiporter [Candidatus Woesearchaeota archaeon]|nr:sodium:calcium antiporter [Candidatus Woesearchaeota archaeon]